MSAALPVLCLGAVLWDVIGRSPAPMGPGADVPGRIRHQPGVVMVESRPSNHQTMARWKGSAVRLRMTIA